MNRILFRLHGVLTFLMLVLLARNALAYRQQTQTSNAVSPVVRYVVTSGNDAWSGTLAAPNRARTDGPFATFDRAFKALSNDGEVRADSGGSQRRLLVSRAA